eukprot:UN24288
MIEHQWRESVDTYEREDGKITYGAVHEFVRRCRDSPLGYTCINICLTGFQLFEVTMDIIVCVYLWNYEEFFLFFLLGILISIPLFVIWVRSCNSYWRKQFGWTLPVSTLFLSFGFDVYSLYLIGAQILLGLLSASIVRPSLHFQSLDRTRNCVMLLTESLGSIAIASYLFHENNR